MVECEFARLTGGAKGKQDTVVFADKSWRLTPPAQELDRRYDGVFKKARKLSAATSTQPVKDVLATVFPGPRETVRFWCAQLPPRLTELSMAVLGGKVAAAAQVSGEGVSRKIEVCFPKGLKSADGSSPELLAASFAAGFSLRSYRFDRYFSEPDRRNARTVLLVRCSNPQGAEEAFLACQARVQGTVFARDLAFEPPNVLFPQAYAERIQELQNLGLQVEVLTPKELEPMGFRTLLGVAQGSSHEARVVVIRWPGTEGRPVSLVGKGVTFDTGGISIKPSQGMEEMKMDMAGSAAVVGAMKCLAMRRAKAHVVGVVGLVENMPDGNAQRPGDIVTTLSGKTVEIQNTDAEGRLVLADLLTYTQRTHNPTAVVDLATLTGAMMVALGHTYAGFFSNSPALTRTINKAGELSGEKVWPMPLDEAYDKQLKSNVADMRNIGGRWAGGITAAQFLGRFVENNCPWVHLDIAGTAWTYEAQPLSPQGASGFGVRLLDRFVSLTFRET